MKTLRVGGAGLLVVAGMAVSGVSAAQEPDPAPEPSRARAGEDEGGARDEGDRDRRGRDEDEDGARFRGGVRFQAGVLAFPDPGEALPNVGVQGHIGAQINDLVGVYWAPSLDIIFGSVGGPSFGAAVMVDFTIDDTFQIGVGPDSGVFVAGGNGTAGAAALYGGRLHFAAFPLVGDGESPIRRKGLAIGADVRLLTGASVFANTGGATGSANAFVIAPIAFIGYEAF